MTGVQRVGLWIMVTVLFSLLTVAEDSLWTGEYTWVGPLLHFVWYAASWMFLAGSVKKE